jgi:TRAP-type C4-dicarboxylate transport system permease large subunit
MTNPVQRNVGVEVCSRFGLDVMVAISVDGNQMRKPFEADAKSVGPFILAEIVALMFLTYIPELVLFIPRLLGYA